MRTVAPRRGFSLVEMGWVLAVMAILAATGMYAWSSLRAKSDGYRPSADLTAVALMQSQTLQSRGSFADSPAAMSALVPSMTFVAGDQPASSMDGTYRVSTSASAAGGSGQYTAVAYAAAKSDAGLCYGIRVPDPRSGQAPVKVKRTAAESPSCTASAISTGTATGW